MNPVIFISSVTLINFKQRKVLFFKYKSSLERGRGETRIHIYIYMLGIQLMHSGVYKLTFS